MAEPHQLDLIRLLRFLGPGETEPRVIAIVGAAYIESYLGTFIKEHLPGLDAKVEKRLFDPERPLGTFAARIDIAKALDILTNRGRNEAIKIARVRNRFAHNVAIADFDHPEVAEIIDTMDAFPKFQLTHDGYEIDDQDMSRRETVTSLIREFCFSLDRELSPGSWGLSETDLHVEPHPPSPRKSRGKTHLPPEGLTNRSDRWPPIRRRSSPEKQ